jgi:hypothetical protein
LTAHERGYPLLTCAAQNVVATADELAKLVATASADRTEFARTNMRYENVADELTDAILVNITTRVPAGRCPCGDKVSRTRLDDVRDAAEVATTGGVLSRCRCGSGRRPGPVHRVVDGTSNRREVSEQVPPSYYHCPCARASELPHGNVRAGAAGVPGSNRTNGSAEQTRTSG